MPSEDTDELFSVLESTDDQLMIRLTHDLKMENAPEFAEVFQSTLGPTQKYIVADFSKIRFVDSSGVGTLLKCANIVRERGGGFKIYGLSRSLLSVFKLAGLLKIFTIIEEEEARKSHPQLFS